MVGVLEGGTVAFCGRVEVSGSIEGGSVKGGGTSVVACGVNVLVPGKCQDRGIDEIMP